MPESAVQVNQFARVFVDSPASLPPQADCHKSDRGYWYRLNLQTVDEDAAAALVRKARKQFDVELVHQVREGDQIAKERRYVETVADVPEGYAPERGPKGGIYYETDPLNGGSETTDVGSATASVGYNDEPVLAVQFEDVEEGDRIAFEQEDGERDMGEVVGVNEEEHLVTVESGDGQTDVAAAPLDVADGETSKGEGTVTSDTGGAHNAVYSPQRNREEDEDDDETQRAEKSLRRLWKDCEGHHVGPELAEDYQLQAGDVLCEDHDQVVDMAVLDRGRCPCCGEPVDTAEVGKAEEDVWVYYVGPNGGEGWQNMRTGEIRYQKQRPGPAPEGGDGYGDWTGEGWTEPPDDTGVLADEVEVGQELEVATENEYVEGEVTSEVDGEEVEYESEYGSTEVASLEDITAYEEGFDRLEEQFESWIEDSPWDSLDDYWDDIYDRAPDHAPPAAQLLDYNSGAYTIETPATDLELPLVGYIEEGEDVGTAGPVVSTEDIIETEGEEQLEKFLGAPEEVGPTVTLPNDSIVNMVAQIDESDVDAVADTQADDEPTESAEVADDAVGEAVSTDLPDGLEQTEPEPFVEAVEAFAEANPDKEDFLTFHDPDEFSDHDLFMAEDGSAGVAVDPEGDVQNVFSDSEAMVDGDTLMEAAIDAGGETLDCYDGFLKRFYMSHEFEVTGQIEFNPEYAPEGWEDHEYLEDKPPVLFMAHEPEEPVEVTEYDGSEWAEAKADSQRAADTGGDSEGQGEGMGEGAQGGDPASGGTGGHDGGVSAHTAGVVAGGFSYEDADEWGTLGDYHFPTGVSQQFMRVGATEEYDGETNEGLVFGNFYGGHDELGIDPAEQADPSKAELGQRQMVTYHMADALGGNVPTAHSPDDGDTVYMEGVEGANVGSAPSEYLEQVDPDEFYEQAAIQIICGNNDAHMQNVMVTPDGTPVFHDIDHSAGGLNSTFTGAKPQYDNAVDRTVGELWRAAQHVVDDGEQEAKQRMMEAAKQKASQVAQANGITDDAVTDGHATAAEVEQSLADNIRNNIVNLATDSLDYTYS